MSTQTATQAAPASRPTIVAIQPGMTGETGSPTGGSPALRTPPPPERYGLPAAYRQQAVAHTHDALTSLQETEYWNKDRIAASGKYQHHVYAWGAELVRKRHLKSVLDVGCGPGTKLGKLIAPVCSDIEGIDQPSGVAAARKLGAPGKYSEVDLEQPQGVRPWRTFDLIICADVVEHLLDPDPAMMLLKGFCHEHTLLVLSTPDRARLHGRDCMASNKPEHVREWTHPEFTRFLISRGFDVISSRMYPADDSAPSVGRWRELAWRLHLAPTSPHRCQTVLCRIAQG